MLHFLTKTLFFFWGVGLWVGGKTIPLHMTEWNNNNQRVRPHAVPIKLELTCTLFMAVIAFVAPFIPVEIEVLAYSA